MVKENGNLFIFYYLTYHEYDANESYFPIFNLPKCELSKTYVSLLSVFFVILLFDIFLFVKM